MTYLNGMTVWRDAFNPFNGMTRELKHFFDDLPESGFLPTCDINEQEGHYLLTLEIPGVKKEDIKMEIAHHQIMISGERRNEVKEVEGGQTYSEIKFGKFQRTFTLPTGLDTSLVEANYQEGILRVIIPKAESAKPRLVKISSGSEGSQFLRKLLTGKNTEGLSRSDEN